MLRREPRIVVDSRENCRVTKMLAELGALVFQDSCSSLGMQKQTAANLVFTVMFPSLTLKYRSPSTSSWPA